MSRRKSRGPVLVQSFRNDEQAREAMRSLLEAGFDHGSINIMKTRQRDDSASEGPLSPWTEVPGVGLVSAGPLLALFREEAQASPTCGLSQILRLLGVDKELADYYHKQADAGETIVIATMDPPVPSPQPAPFS